MTRWLEGVCRVLCVLALAGALFSLGRAFLERREMATYPERYLIVSGRPAERDALYRELDARANVLQYARADSLLAKKLEAAMPAKSRLAVYVERGGKTVSVGSTSADLSKAIAAADKESRSQILPSLALAVALGLGAAALVRPTLLTVLLGLGLGLTAALAKVWLACPTCPVDRIIGVPVGVAGAAAFAAAIGVTVITASPVAARVIGCAAAAGALAQVIAVVVSATNCAPCSVAAGANAMLGGMLAMHGGPSSPARELSPWAARAIAGLAAIAAIGAAVAPTPRAESPLPSLTVQKRVWAGRPAAELGIATPKAFQLVCVVAANCSPCHDATRDITAEPELDVRFLEFVPRGHSRLMEIPPFEADAQKLSQTPAFFIVDNQGKVIYESYGWASSPEWKAAFFKSVREILLTKVPSARIQSNSMGD